MNTENYLAKWLSGELEDTELKVFKESPEYQEYARIVAHTDNWKAPDYDVNEQLELLTEKIHSKKEVKVIKMNPARLWLRIAAVAIIIFGTTFFMMRDTQVNTAYAQTDVIALPDESEITLNADSEISYNKIGWNGERVVTLKGEAFFKVKKGQTFDVITNQGTVSVLGTQFNVKDRTNYYEVVCYEGLVKVSFNDEQKLLHPGESFKVVYGEIIKEVKLESVQPSWIVQESSFKSTPLHMVFEELERQFNVDVKGIENKDKPLFTGGFKHSDLETALKSVCIPLNLSYQINKDGTVNIDLP